MDKNKRKQFDPKIIIQKTAEVTDKPKARDIPDKHEDELQFSQEKEILSRDRFAATLTTKMRKLVDLMETNHDPHTVRFKYTKWMQVYESFLVSQGLIDKSLPSIEEGEKGDLHKKFFAEFKARVEGWFLQESDGSLQHEHNDHENSVISHSTRSSRRSQRSASSLRSCLSDVAVKEAELEAKSAILKRKQELEKKALELKLQTERLQIEEDLAVAKAEKRVLQQIEDRDRESLRNRKEKVGRKRIEETVGDENDNLPSCNNSHRTEEYVETIDPDTFERKSQSKDWDRHSNNSSDSSHISIADMMVSMVKEIKKPKAEIEKFDGSIKKYRKFRRQFNCIVANTDNIDDKMVYLEQYTVGKPHEIVSGYGHLDAELGFPAALKELDRRYGDQDATATSYVNTAIEWSPLKANDTKGLDDFSIFLTECNCAIQGMKGLQVMEYTGNLQIMASKLPYHLREKWSTKATEMSDKDIPIRFADFVDFVRKESRKANNPIYGKEAMNKLLDTNKTGTPGKKQPSSRNRGGASFSTNLEYGKKKETASIAVNVKENADGKKAPCLFCKNVGHGLIKCSSFVKKTIEERIEFLKRNGICFGCLKGGHMKFNCTEKMQCSTCKKTHPVILHMTGSAKTVSSTQLSIPSKDTSLMGAGVDRYDCTLSIVAVKVKMKNSNRTVNTYAFHDPGSTVCFCTEWLMTQLGVRCGRRKRITLSTMGEQFDMDTSTIEGFEISGINSSEYIQLPTVYSKANIPVSKNHIPRQKDIDRWPHLEKVTLTDLNADIGLLIGNCVPEAYTPIENVTGPPNSPFASLTKLGWMVWCMSRQNDGNASDEITSNFVSKEIQIIETYEETKNLERSFQNYVNLDFPEKLIDDKKELSIEDKRFTQIAKESMIFDNGQYTMDLPFKQSNIVLPNNKEQVLRRLAGVKKKLCTDPKFYNDYNAFMQDVIDQNYAELISEKDLDGQDGKVWYIPHHGIYHPRKPDKLRVVFDCSAKYRGICLNDLLLVGATNTLTSNLLSVLLRFRQEIVAVMADIRSMFYRVKIPEYQRDYLRFYWWPDGDLTKEPREYRMSVHLFGATSSPSCANSALRRTAEDNCNDFDPDVIDTIKRNFYVDDCLRSLESTTKAIELVKSLTELCHKGGFHLTKWISNHRSVLETIPVEEQAKDLKHLDLNYDDLPIEHALGVRWSVEEDVFGFKIKLSKKPATRRGILSVVCSIFDPLGLAAPYVLPAKIILQELCQRKLAWDEEIDGDILKRWNKWLSNLPKLEELSVPRSFKPVDFGEVIDYQIHHFSDASEQGYGVVSYVRLTNKHGRIHCCLVTAKARVSPLQKRSIPKMELNAATVAVRIHHMISREMDYKWNKVYFWTDSQTVLRYIANQTSRFHTFVANRLVIIHEGSEENQWHYIDTKSNPADDCSRGLFVEKKSFQRWVNGPAFLWKPECEWLMEDFDKTLSKEDPEVKLAVNLVERIESPLENLISRYSSWTKLKKILGWVLFYLKKLKNRRELRRNGDPELVEIKKKKNVDPMDIILDHDSYIGLMAEKCILQFVQKQYFSSELKVLIGRRDTPNKDLNLKKTSCMIKLDPVLSDDLIRVGGRLNRSDLPEESKHPVILPKESKVSTLIIEEIHRRMGHLGKNCIIAELRHKYWILNASAIVKCVTCRKYQAGTGKQKMADLPVERFAVDEPPFTNTGIDYFGPFEIKRGRSMVKRYGVIFTCLTIRAIHLEVSHSLSTDSCINAIKRFIARRGSVKTIVTDNGSNFIGAAKELPDIKWKFNPPLGSHFGGIWERQIRTVRKVMFSILKEQVVNLDDETLQTLFCEIEYIINSRPITKPSDDVNDLNALTPNDLLYFKSKSVPPGVFSKNDLYCRRRWRQAQYLADLFWTRWVREYLPSLQERSKWTKQERNLQLGDIVLLVDNMSQRSSWSLGKVIEIFPDRKGFVRVVKVKTKTTIYMRPIDKLCLILESDIH